MSGLIADSRTLVDRARVEAQVRALFTKIDNPFSLKIEKTVHVVMKELETVMGLTSWTLKNRDGVMVICNGNALQCITIFKVMGSNV